jgi:hypothetical protein
MSHDIILWVSFPSSIKIFIITAMETHKGPPYIPFKHLITFESSENKMIIQTEIQLFLSTFKIFL